MGKGTIGKLKIQMGRISRAFKRKIEEVKNGPTTEETVNPGKANPLHPKIIAGVLINRVKN